RYAPGARGAVVDAPTARRAEFTGSGAASDDHRDRGRRAGQGRALAAHHRRPDPRMARRKQALPGQVQGPARDAVAVQTRSTMTREAITTAIEALEYQHRQYEKMLDREPRTRNRKINVMRTHLLQCMNSINEAKAALAAKLEEK